MIFHNLQPSEYIFKSTIAVPIVVNFILFFNTQNYFLHLLWTLGNEWYDNTLRTYERNTQPTRNTSARKQAQHNEREKENII